jgi:hypothetical protein
MSGLFKSSFFVKAYGSLSMMIVATESSIMEVHPASWAISTDETFATVVKVGRFVSFLAVPSI